MASPYISCPGRVLLGVQQVLSETFCLSKTINSATSCRNNGSASMRSLGQRAGLCAAMDARHCCTEAFFIIEIQLMFGIKISTNC
jgi:hypothetical protein